MSGGIRPREDRVAFHAFEDETLRACQPRIEAGVADGGLHGAGGGIEPDLEHHSRGLVQSAAGEVLRAFSPSSERIVLRHSATTAAKAARRA